ncbi:hypothetical protein ASJ81_15670 [Methanosarcina spelaei]|uniref:Uncharacterized protein n=1 Tax=Methanosarcina spelaei TaxID=1036679 RepID=A0A2A2HWX0_9EURY|nr:hypothetical protein ASJ81_15670 [Methanosarcina spelaei]
MLIKTFYQKCKNHWILEQSLIQGKIIKLAHEALEFLQEKLSERKKYRFRNTIFRIIYQPLQHMYKNSKNLNNYISALTRSSKHLSYTRIKTI